MIRAQRRVHPWLWIAVLAAAGGLLLAGLLVRSPRTPVENASQTGAAP